jgi:signal transduction histidine kinase
MHRPWIIMLSFAAALAVALAALGWVTLLAIERDRAEALARRQAALEENVRLALWRMDSAVAPLVAAENARPPQGYVQGSTAPDAPPAPPPDTKDAPASQTALTPEAPPAQAPSTALAEVPSHALDALPVQRARPTPLIPLHVLGYFELPESGESLKIAPLTPVLPAQTEQMPLERQQAGQAASVHLAETDDAAFDLVAESLARELASFEHWEQLPRSGELPRDPPPALALNSPAVGANVAEVPQLEQQQRSAIEYFSRAKLLMQNQVPLAAAEDGSDAARMAAGPLHPLWMDGRLVLARRVQSPGGDWIQGCWLDWDALRKDLLAQIRDLLPQADLVPARVPPLEMLQADGRVGVEEQSRLMATLPVRLVPRPLPEASSSGLSPLAVSLALAWAAALVAASAVAVLLGGVVSLSERRAAFVGAVTHELRTPLTTFRMYAEMLSEGMVADQARQRCYLETLRHEADRLSHLVENVLAYARLERGRHTACLPVPVERLLAQVVPRLQLRAAACGRNLELEIDEAARPLAVSADVCAVEQILFNLVDNACKYAVGTGDERIHLEVEPRDVWLLVRVRDHGPGFSRTSSRRLFKPFSKSAHDAAQTAPGVGLGLALCRRLARGMRGELTTEQQPAGACVVLQLRQAQRSKT